jgi:hypothetical protein
MSAVLTRRRNRRGTARDRDAGRQPSLFSQVVAPPPLEVQPRTARAAEPDTATATAVLERPSLDEAMAGLWAGLAGSEVASCPVCGDAMKPRHSAGAGVVGGRCSGCATTLS